MAIPRTVRYVRSVRAIRSRHSTSRITTRPRTFGLMSTANPPRPEYSSRRRRAIFVRMVNRELALCSSYAISRTSYRLISCGPSRARNAHTRYKCRHRLRVPAVNSDGPPVLKQTRRPRLVHSSNVGEIVLGRSFWLIVSGNGVITITVNEHITTHSAHSK